MIVEFGLQMHGLEFERYRVVAQEAEGLGFDLVTVPDHIVHEMPGGTFDAKTLAYDPMVIAATICEATKRINIGHLVLCTLFRHPAITAQALASLDRLSGGRIVAGLGAGWTETEFRMTGIPFPDVRARLEMLDETLTCLRSLWSRDVTTFEGRHYHFRDAILWPKPVRQPPIVVGGGGRGLLRVAAKHADVVNIVADVGKTGRLAFEEAGRLTENSYRDKIDFVHAEAWRHGRAIRVSNIIFSLVLCDSRGEASQASAAMAEAFGTSIEALARSPLALIGTPEECVTELRRRVREWGISQFIFGGGAHKVARRLWEQVLSHLSQRP